MAWTQTLVREGLTTLQGLSALVPLWPQTAANLTVAIAGYVAAAGLLAATRLRQQRLATGVLLLWALGAAAMGTVHLIEALSFKFAVDTPLTLIDGISAVTMLGAAFSLVYQLPKLLTPLDSASLDPSETTGKTLAAGGAIAPSPQLEQQVVACSQALEKAQSSKDSLLQQEKSVRSELEIALENLRVTAERLNIALSAARMGSWEWDLETQEQHWSPQAKAILGFEMYHRTLKYADWAERLHPQDLPKVEAAIAQARTHREIFTAEYRIRIPGDGGWRWVLSQGRFVFPLQGEPRRMIGVLQEITQDKQASLALQASEARFRAVFEQAAVGMARLAPEGDWLQVNERFCQLLGYPAEEILGKHFQAFTDPADREQSEYYYQQLIQGEVDSCRFEKRYVNRDSTSIWVMVTVSAERDLDDNAIALIAVIEDIRDLKQARLELEQRAGELGQVNNLLAMTNALLENRNAELDQFAYVASHDLKAPLRAIANLSEWIEEDLSGQLPKENQHQLALLRNRVHRMEALINGLLEYSRVGRRERQIVEVDVRQMLEEAIDFLAPPASFTFVLPEEAPILQTNQTALNQVLTNLIGNAVKHHDREAGLIQVTAEERGNLVEFAVTDNGPGIAPEYHNKVFTIFQTLKSRDELESTGIGLSLVKKIVESEGGTIALESESGKGATFRFTWPKQ